MAGAEVKLTGGRGDGRRGRRAAVIGGEEVELEVIRGTPAPGEPIAGPAVVELPESTAARRPPGGPATVDETGTIHDATR